MVRATSDVSACRVLVLDHLRIRLDTEADDRLLAVRVADPVRPVDEVLLGQPEVAVEVVPRSESRRGGASS